MMGSAARLEALTPVALRFSSRSVLLAPVSVRPKQIQPAHIFPDSRFQSTVADVTFTVRSYTTKCPGAQPYTLRMGSEQDIVDRSTPFIQSDADIVQDIAAYRAVRCDAWFVARRRTPAFQILGVDNHEYRPSRMTARSNLRLRRTRFVFFFWDLDSAHSRRDRPPNRA